MNENQVSEAVMDVLRRSRANGYFLATSYSEDELERICADMLDLDAAMEGLEIEQLRPYVKGFFRRTGQYRGE